MFTYMTLARWGRCVIDVCGRRSRGRNVVESMDYYHLRKCGAPSLLLNTTACQVREVAYLYPFLPCDRCQVAALRRIQERIVPQFDRLSAFLQEPAWEATNNGAERAGRAFRHRQAPHFNLRSEEAIEGAIVVTACQRQAARTQAPRVSVRSGRGRPAQEGGEQWRERQASKPVLNPLPAATANWRTDDGTAALAA